MPALDYNSLLKSVGKGEILPAYYFHGDEDVLKDDAQKALLDKSLDPSTRDFNFDRRRAGELSADDFWALVLTPPMLAARRVLVLTDADALLQRRPRAQALRAAILKYAASPSPDTLLIVSQSAGEKPDGELAQALTSVAFEPLSPDRVRRWIRHKAEQEGLAIDEDGARHLHEAVGDDLAQLAAEISKLSSAVSGRAATQGDVSDLVGIRRGETTHDFVDAVTGRNFAAAAGMVHHLLELPGNTGVRLVMSLGTALVGLALARALLDKGGAPPVVAAELFRAIQASRPMGLRGWREEAERWAKDAAGWTLAGIEQSLEALLRADKRLKNPSLGDDAEIVLDAVFAMSGETRAAA